MADALIVLPIVAGKSEEWRRFVQQLQGSMLTEFTDAVHRLGVERLSVWLADTRIGHIAVADMKASRDLVDIQDDLMTSQEPFELWFKERVHALHGVDLSSSVGGLAAELICNWTTDS
ncbi:MAG TPA: hypothetical protein VFW17_10540 [Ktedonobacterales bacterium]|jgi:hypothetical protein|nr:hypothetical protein [Ktedonobacterales bacterium]